jgi:ElaB/YqjD/DUF883 family membrane-anchored ribosome-binding protein
MNGNRTSETLDQMNTHSNPRTPSGFEVESATLKVPVETIVVTPMESSSSSSMSSPSHGTMEKVASTMSGWKSRGMDAVQQVRHTVTEKVAELTPVVTAKMDSVRNDTTRAVANANTKMSHMRTELKIRWANWRYGATQSVNGMTESVKSGASGSMSKLQSDVTGNPMKWAGISAGAGLGIGMISRWMHHRHKYHRPPQVVIVRSAC